MSTSQESSRDRAACRRRSRPGSRRTSGGRAGGRRGRVAVWRRSPVEAPAGRPRRGVLVRSLSSSLGVTASGVAGRPPRWRSGRPLRSRARSTRCVRWVGVVVRRPDRRSTPTRLLLQVEGERFEVWVRGPATQAAGWDTWQQGDRVWVGGAPPAHAAGGTGCVAARRRGVRLRRPRRRTRRATAGVGIQPRPESDERGTSSMPSADAALARGLIIGDDRDQPPSHDRPLPAQRPVAPDGGVGPERRSWRWRSAGPLLRRAARRSCGSLAHTGGDRLVRRADPGRAVGAAGRDDGRVERGRVRPRPASGSRRGCSPWP